MFFDDFPFITTGLICTPELHDNFQRKIDSTLASYNDAPKIASSSKENDQVPIIGIERHRLLTDGEGITTLVGFQGCPLRCKYCINKQCWEQSGATYYTPEKLYNELKKDNLYFLYTHGGITFGGGEPGLYCDFILNFKSICHPDWRIYMETSLNIPILNLQKLLPVIDYWIVDIKDVNEIIYRKYTGCANEQVISNLRYLSENGYSDKVQIRLPLIPSYNTNKEREISEQKLRELGFEKFNKFNYKTDVKTTSELHENHNKINYGKAVCEVLKQARIELAKENAIKYKPHNCSHLQCKSGSCPVCENELTWLENQINKTRRNV